LVSQSVGWSVIILPVILYGCESWSVTLWKEHRLILFENKVLFGPRRGEVTGYWRKVHNEELHNIIKLLGFWDFVQHIVF